MGAMTGAEVGMVEKKQGRLTFPERDPVIGLIIDNALEAERQKGKKGYKHSSTNADSFNSVFFVKCSAF